MNAANEFIVDIHEAFGAPLIGTWLNAALLMLSMVQLWSYLEDSTTSKSWWTWKRGLSLFMLILDLAGSASACWFAYTDVVVKWGSVEALTTMNAALPVLVATTALNLATSHAFLILRYLKLSRRRLVALVLSVFAVAVLAGGIALVVACAALSSGLDSKQTIDPFIIAWTVGGVVACTLLAGGLASHSWNIKPTSEQDTKPEPRESWTSRAASIAMSSGCFTTMVALAQLISYLARRDTNLFLVFTMCLGRTCTITVHYNLNWDSESRNESLNLSGPRSSIRLGKVTKPNPFEETRLASEVLRAPHRQQGRQSSVRASISVSRDGAMASLHHVECQPEGIWSGDGVERGLEKGADITGAEREVIKGFAL